MALANGWDIFSEDCGGYRIHGLDDPDRVAKEFGLTLQRKFTGPSRDRKARRYVEEQAAAGDKVCQRALDFLATHPVPLYLWLRIGDNDEYDDFGQDESALADALYEARIRSEDIDWLHCPRNPTDPKNHGFYLPRAGFVTPTYGGDNYVSLYWGDEDGNLRQPLTKTDQREIVSRLKRLEEDDGYDDLA